MDILTFRQKYNTIKIKYFQEKKKEGRGRLSSALNAKDVQVIQQRRVPSLCPALDFLITDARTNVLRYRSHLRAISVHRCLTEAALQKAFCSYFKVAFIGRVFQVDGGSGVLQPSFPNSKFQELWERARTLPAPLGPRHGASQVRGISDLVVRPLETAAPSNSIVGKRQVRWPRQMRW